MTLLEESSFVSSTFGASGPRISRVGLGTMGLTGFYGPTTETEAIDAVRYALDIGINLFSTADFYGQGGVERIVGQGVSGRRDQAVIATKLGMRLDENRRPTRMDGSPEYLRRACDLSLQRLCVDCIDVVILCRLDPAVAIEDSIGALADLVREGKAKSIGLSEVSARTIRRAHTVHPISAVETEFSLWERHVEADILPTARELGIGIIAHTPLGRGFLTGQYASVEDLAPDDQRRHHPRFAGANFAHNKNLVDGIDDVARRHGATKAQIALAWLLSKGADIVPVPGTRRAQRMQENVQAANVRLSDADKASLDQLFAPQNVAGLRQAPFYLAAVEQC